LDIDFVYLDVDLIPDSIAMGLGFVGLIYCIVGIMKSAFDQSKATNEHSVFQSRWSYIFAFIMMLLGFGMWPLDIDFVYLDVDLIPDSIAMGLGFVGLIYCIVGIVKIMIRNRKRKRGN
jgi:threonine/homoserine efflux transporter RhtA